MQNGTDANRIVVIGAGHAASEFTGALRAGGFSGPVLMLGEEAHLPYQRPPLSKAFLSGEAALGALELKSAAVGELAQITPEGLADASRPVQSCARTVN